MLLVEQHTLALAGQAASQFRRAGVIAQLAIRVHVVQHLQIVGRQRRQIRGVPQAADTFQPFSGACGLITFQVVEAEPGVGVEIGERLLLARHEGDQASQGEVFEHVGVVAGMVGVTVIHGSSWQAAQFSKPEQ